MKFTTLQWASESIKIPYKHPLNGKFSVYVPDFFIAYVDKNGRQHADVIEIKPENQTKMESVGRNRYNQAQLIINQAKWKSARLWCKNRGFSFKVINEADIFHTGSKR